MSPLNCTIIRYDIIMTLINFTKEELYKIEECINGDGNTYGDPVFESILDKIVNCPDLYTKIERTN